ncbi:Mor transcription activator family protein [Lysinibacillus piscis]|uniref:Mor transcription activator domain-containing protein n=1 Tax=Lysinibacillus piscis TaxID=2518931 RepID=A0ABQ5NGK9_9BACI|nr:Mor transcription activator family protein [Lysinibacillus sp. KH24]GLC87510.1 hypothetical protein LYSBPC_06370 [Lysinibacillus sp. KH24]
MDGCITVSMLPEEYQGVAELVGIDLFLKLCSLYGGSSLYIPKKERVTRHIRDIKIKSEFNEGNYKELSRKYNLSESHIRKIVGNPRIIEQTTIFNFLEEN